MRLIQVKQHHRDVSLFFKISSQTGLAGGEPPGSTADLKRRFHLPFNFFSVTHHDYFHAYYYSYYHKTNMQPFWA